MVCSTCLSQGRALKGCQSEIGFFFNLCLGVPHILACAFSIQSNTSFELEFLSYSCLCMRQWESHGVACIFQEKFFTCNWCTLAITLQARFAHSMDLYCMDYKTLSSNVCHAAHDLCKACLLHPEHAYGPHARALTNSVHKSRAWQAMKLEYFILSQA